LKSAFVDTSFLASVVFNEPAGTAMAKTLRTYQALYASDLLVAELLAAAVRESVASSAVLPILHSIAIVVPDRSIESEIQEVLSHGYLRGADVWHLACALFVAGGDRSALSFLTRDAKQGRSAAALGLNAAQVR